MHGRRWRKQSSYRRTELHCRGGDGCEEQGDRRPVQPHKLWPSQSEGVAPAHLVNISNQTRYPMWHKHAFACSPPSSFSAVAISCVGGAKLEAFAVHKVQARRKR